MSPPNPLPPLLSSTSSRPRPNLSGTCGTAGRVMRVGRVPLKRGERVPGPPNLSPVRPAIPVLQPGPEHLKPPPCRGASRGATGVSQVSVQVREGREPSGKGGFLGGLLGRKEVRAIRPKETEPHLTPDSPRTFLHIFVCAHSKSMFTCVSRSWHSTPGSLSLLTVASRRVGRRWAGSLQAPRASA